MKNRRAPYRWVLGPLLRHCREGLKQQQPDGSWMPARPLGYDSLSMRLRLAWAVFTGRADALFWSDKS
jgi:hypothetical protein